MKRLVLLGFMLSVFSGSISAMPVSTIICNSVILDRDVPEDSPLLKGYLRLQLEPSPKAWVKMTGEDEEYFTTDIRVERLSNLHGTQDEILTRLMFELHIDRHQVSTATTYTVRTFHGHVETLFLFFDAQGRELGRGGLMGLMAIFRCMP